MVFSTFHARTVIVATGAYEQPAVFRNNDAPGVMLASAAARLAYRYAVAPFENACVIAGNDDAYTTALELQHAGLSISAVIDIGDPATCASRAAAAIAAGIQVIPNAEISHADTRRGNSLRSLSAAALSVLSNASNAMAC